MNILSKLINTLLILPAVNVYLLYKTGLPFQLALFSIIILFVTAAVPVRGRCGIKSARLRQCQAGVELLWAFLLSVSITAAIQLYLLSARLCLSGWKEWLLDILAVILVENIVFWSGMVRVYIVSAQLAVRWRVIAAVCGWIPVVHLIVLGKVIRIVSDEVKTENDRILLNEQRAMAGICRTKYPILLLHGVFFRDSRYFNYWGRIPAELEKNGARIFYGNHQSAASVKESAEEIAARIQEIRKQTGCEKVNIIAHSKGGLDARYAIAKLGMAPYVASLTTVNTPHRGCEFADYLLEKIGPAQQNMVAKAYNSTLSRLGDTCPDFLGAVEDLKSDACKKRNAELFEAEQKIAPDVYVQSIGSCLKKPSGGRFPLNLSNRFVRHFDGANDGLVGRNSFEWGHSFIWLEASGMRGLSHGDMIDLNRENFQGFDVREFYVQLVSDLKNRGF